MPRFVLGLLTLTAALGCSSAPVAPLKVAPHQELASATPVERKPPIYAGWTAAEQAALTEAVDETMRTLDSLEFQRNLASLDDLYDKPTGEAVKGTEILQTMLTGRLPVTYAGSEVAHETGDTDIFGCRALTHLNKTNLDRWPPEKTKPDENAPMWLKQSCLVNTLAHELTHTIPGAHGMVYLDDDHKSSPHPLVSYTVGSIAQCAYLQTKGHLKPELFWACVEAIGTRVFVDVCEDKKWLDELKPKSAG